MAAAIISCRACQRGEKWRLESHIVYMGVKKYLVFIGREIRPAPSDIMRCLKYRLIRIFLSGRSLFGGHIYGIVSRI